jgi:hypothetical protein
MSVKRQLEMLVYGCDIWIVGSKGKKNPQKIIFAKDFGLYAAATFATLV